MDITHYKGNGFLTLTDCRPIRFTVWRQLTCQDASDIVRKLRSIFFERGALAEILTDNAPAFCSQNFLAFTDEWDIRMGNLSESNYQTADAPPDFTKDRLMGWSVLRQCWSMAHPIMWKIFADAINQLLRRKTKVTHHPVVRWGSWRLMNWKANIHLRS